MKQPFFPGQPPDCEIQARKGGLVCGVAFWPICDSIPFCAKAGKEYAKRTRLYLQWNEVFGGNVEVPVLDFSWGGRRKLMFLLIKIDHGCIGIMSPYSPYSLAPDAKLHIKITYRLAGTSLILHKTFEFRTVEGWHGQQFWQYQ